MFKAYLKELGKFMKKEGLPVLGAMIFTLGPFAVFLLKGMYVLPIVWFIIATPLSSSFAAFHITYDKKND